MCTAAVVRLVRTVVVPGASSCSASMKVASRALLAFVGLGLQMLEMLEATSRNFRRQETSLQVVSLPRPREHGLTLKDRVADLGRRLPLIRKGMCRPY